MHKRNSSLFNDFNIIAKGIRSSAVKATVKFSLRLIGFAMFSAAFNLVIRVGLIFGKLKGCSLQINS